MLKTIEEIFQALKDIENRIIEKDPLGQAWNLRITTVYRIFRAFDVYHFRLEPADPEKVLDDLRDVLSFIEQSPVADRAGQTSSDTLGGKAGLSEEARDKRMQYLYGLAWAQLSRDQYYDAADLLYKRIHNSNLDTSFIKGARCLDIATGIARYALAMVQLGAREVVGTDFSRECLAEAERRLAGSVESQKIKLVYMDLYKTPKEMEEAFDFVCANGVIHHLPDPAGGLEVTARCTKPGGHAFVFVFTKNEAPWWPAIELMRRLAAPVPIQYAHKVLSFYEVPGTKIFNTLDYSYTPIQHKLDREWVKNTFHSVGFKKVQELEGGVIHDTALRCRLFEADRALFGISESRYLLRK